MLFDTKGDVGRTYGATVTPHMYVIKADGTLAYMGGIDDKATTRLDDLKTAKNFVDTALDEIAQGKPVSTTTARPYGCTVKYSVVTIAAQAATAACAASTLCLTTPRKAWSFHLHGLPRKPLISLPRSSAPAIPICA